MQEPEINKTSCRNCGANINHHILHEVVEDGTVEDENGAFEYGWSRHSQIVKCCGCDLVSFRVAENDSDSPEETEFRFPSDAEQRKPMPQYYSLPSKVRKVYTEVLTAFGHRAHTLTAIGIRLIVESICLDQNVPGNNLKTKIDALVTKGVLSEVQATFLHKTRFMGNEAAHEIQTPEHEEIEAALEIAETLLKAIYILPKIAENL